MSKKISSLKIQRLLKEARHLCQFKKISEAKLIYHDLLKVIPHHPEVLGNLGTIELQLGNTQIGLSYLKNSIKVDFNNPAYLTNLANGLSEIGKFEEALLYLDTALKFSPSTSNIFYNKARIYKAISKHSEAITSYQQAIRLDPKNILAYLNLGFIFNELENYESAIKIYSEAIEYESKNSELYYNRGIAYENLRNYKLALQDYNQSLFLNKNLEFAHFNKAGLLAKQGLYDDALISINHAIEINPVNISLYIKKAAIFEHLRKFDEALENYDIALKINPLSTETKSKKSLLKLSLNEFNEGWNLYDHRHWNKSKLQSYQPDLLEFNISNKAIFIWAEQGLGDQIIYASLLPDAFNTKNNFYVSLDPRLLPLFKRSFSSVNNVTFISGAEKLLDSKYDYQLPMGSLGKFFRNSIEDFSSQPTGYLKADEMKSNLLKQKIKKNKQNICGIAWMSKNKEFGEEKSLSLTQLLPILSLPNTIFVNLQYGETTKEIKNISDQHGIEIISIDEIDNFNDIDGLASLIEACDYIVTSSNVTAHIAGALNKKTYLLLPYAYGKIWYWGENDTHSLWYPSIEIYRNTNSKSWEKPIADLSERLRVSYA